MPLANITCPDCGTLVPVSFVVLACEDQEDGMMIVFMACARCPRCYTQRGDTRSLRNFFEADSKAIVMEAIADGLPAIKLGESDE